METIDYIKFVASLALVLGMMGGLALILKKVGLGNIGIVPADLELGIDLSPPVAAAIQPALEQLAATLAELGLPLTPVYGA